jgi:hypothetical protein
VEAADGWLEDIRKGTEGLVPLPVLVVDSRDGHTSDAAGEEQDGAEEVRITATRQKLIRKELNLMDQIFDMGYCL